MRSLVPLAAAITAFLIGMLIVAAYYANR